MAHWSDAKEVRTHCASYFLENSDTIPISDLLVAYQTFKYEELEEAVLMFTLREVLLPKEHLCKPEERYVHYHRLSAHLKDKFVKFIV